MIEINIDIFIYFIIYSFLGWIGEVSYCYLIDRKLTNRGFFYSPIVPLYGFGAIFVYFLLSGFKSNIFLFFILAMIVTSVLEYVTAVMMESLFNIKWWDYSNNKFNIKGRVCLLNSTLFGIGSIIFMYIIHPFITKYVDLISDHYKFLSVDIFLVIILIDLYFTLRKLDMLPNRDIHAFSSLSKNIQNIEVRFRNFEKERDINFLYVLLLLAIAIGTFSIIFFNIQLALSIMILALAYAYVQRRVIKRKKNK